MQTLRQCARRPAPHSDSPTWERKRRDMVQAVGPLNVSTLVEKMVEDQNNAWEAVSKFATEVMWEKSGRRAKNKPLVK